MKSSDLIIGRQPLIEAMQAGRAIDKILFQRNVSGESIGEIRKLAEKRGNPDSAGSGGKITFLYPGQSPGCYCPCGSVCLYGSAGSDRPGGFWRANPLFVLLDGITDVRNIGAIARSAVCCGAQALIIPDKGIAALNEEALKSSAGALEKIHICRVNSLLKAVDSLHLNGILAFASSMQSDKKVYELPI